MTKYVTKYFKLLLTCIVIILLLGAFIGNTIWFISILIYNTTKLCLLIPCVLLLAVLLFVVVVGCFWKDIWQ